MCSFVNAVLSDTLLTTKIFMKAKYVSHVMLRYCENHYDDVMMGAMASQITSLTFIYSTVYSDTDQRKHQCGASLAFVRGIHRGPVNPPHKWPITRKMFPFHDVIMDFLLITLCNLVNTPCVVHMTLTGLANNFVTHSTSGTRVSESIISIDVLLSSSSSACW